VNPNRRTPQSPQTKQRDLGQARPRPILDGWDRSRTHFWGYHRRGSPKPGRWRCFLLLRVAGEIKHGSAVATRLPRQLT